MRSRRAGGRRLIAGPPGSGKTHQILAAVRSHLQRGDTRFRLLTPTATYAEHLRNRLAREGFTFPASCVMTLGRLLSALAPDGLTVPDGAFEIIVEQALRGTRCPEFERVAALPGFRRRLCALFDELSSAGCTAARLHTLLAGDDPLGTAVCAVYREVEHQLAGRGLAFRSERLITASERIKVLGLDSIDAVYLDGFFQFTLPELELVDALASAAHCVVTVPSWAGAQFSHEHLEAIGFAMEDRRAVLRPAARAIVVPAPTIERECEEAARRVLELAERGRPFREIGIIVRGRYPYMPVLRAALDRFGIPARFYFSEPLASHASIHFLQAALEAMLSGWDHARTLAAITSSVSGLAGRAAGYEFEFAVRERLPAAGLEALRAIAPKSPSIDRLILLFEQLDRWRDIVAQPQVWASHLRSLRAFFRGPQSPAGEDARPTVGQASWPVFSEVELWRTFAAALDAFEQAVDETVLAFDAGIEMRFADFWAAVGIVIGAAEIRVQDRRLNVVHVMDVYEARQWELPVTIVCGLVEKEFPRYAQHTAIFSDETRWQWRRQGVHLRTTSDWAVEEEFLFELATTRSSELLVLSYPEQNSAGDPLLRSFALNRYLRERTAAHETARLVRPASTGLRHGPVIAEIRDPVLRSAIAARHTALSPTSIESFLQCPFQFLARKTMKLRARPLRPSDRLSALVQGGIVHAVLSRLTPHSSVDEVFEQAWSEAQAREHLLPGYRAETIRLEMLRALRLFQQNGDLPLRWLAENEREFEFQPAPGLRLRGRMDRLLIGPGGRAVVIDFKYSSKANVEKCVAEHQKGLRVQGGLYMLAAEHLGYTPAGMLYAGLRKEVAWRGWHAGLPELVELGVEARTESALREVIDQALVQAVQAAAAIAEGRVAAHPASTEKCGYCDYADICRVETALAVASASGASIDSQ